MLECVALSRLAVWGNPQFRSIDELTSVIFGGADSYSYPACAFASIHTSWLVCVVSQSNPKVWLMTLA